MSVAGLSAGIRPVYDGVQPLQSLERARNFSADLRDGGRIAGAPRAGGAGQHSCQSTPLRRRGKRGASEQAIGVTKGGRNSKIHAIADKLCRPFVLILTPGNTADCTVGPACVSLVDGIKELLGDKAYDSNSFRKSLGSRLNWLTSSRPRRRQGRRWKKSFGRVCRSAWRCA
jgi:transposase